ncbi:hypothetical protein GA0115234_10681, partial [Streptomyces sp. DvalAA-43]
SSAPSGPTPMPAYPPAEMPVRSSAVPAVTAAIGGTATEPAVVQRVADARRASTPTTSSSAPSSSPTTPVRVRRITPERERASVPAARAGEPMPAIQRSRALLSGRALKVSTGSSEGFSAPVAGNVSRPVVAATWRRDVQRPAPRGRGSTRHRQVPHPHPHRHSLVRAPAPPKPPRRTSAVRPARGSLRARGPAGPSNALCPGARRPAPRGAGRPRTGRPPATPPGSRVLRQEPEPEPEPRSGPERGPARTGRAAGRGAAVRSCGSYSVRYAAARQRPRPAPRHARRSGSPRSHFPPTAPARRRRHHAPHPRPRRRPAPQLPPCRPPFSRSRSCARIRPHRTGREQPPCPSSG